jgi:hypothetical protein
MGEQGLANGGGMKPEGHGDPPTVSCEASSSSPHGARILLDAALVQRLQTEGRLPGSYIGVRKIRPSSRHVAQRLGGRSGSVVVGTPSTTPTPSPVTFKIKDAVTGQERRMTAQEKKAAKSERLRIFRAERVKAREQQQKEDPKQRQEPQNAADPHAPMAGAEPSLQARVSNISDKEVNERFYYFKVNPASLEQELADLRGDRNGVPPVLLSAAQTYVACARNLLPASPAGRDTHQHPCARLDDDYARQWSAALRESMLPALEVRRGEDMRPMVYDIVPQVWNRLRPSFAEGPRGNPAESSVSVARTATLPCHVRPTLPIDEDWRALADVLNQGTNLHIGCGAKFGCDLLVYDGPRHERHSLAGLRLVRSTAGATSFPLPRIYDLAGYVRCLNTAGKLALLATVIRDDAGCRVAILDLALEKLDVNRKTKRVKTIERREQNLTKTK